MTHPFLHTLARLGLSLVATLWIPATPAAADAAAPTAERSVFGPARPPVAARVPHVVKSPQGDREDEYYWLRDDDPRRKRPEVMAYLRAENAHTAAMMAPLKRLQQQLFAEMRSRLPRADSSPPIYRDGAWHWTAYASGAEYPRLMRQAGTPEAPDPKARAEVLLDGPRRAAGKAFYSIGDAVTSPDGRWLAWTEDTGGRRIHTLHLRDLRTGRTLQQTVRGVLEHVVWAPDSQSLYYIRQDPVTLQSGPVYRHVPGTPASQDTLVYEEADKTLFVEIEPTASRRYVLVGIYGYDTTEVRVVDPASPAGPTRVVLQRRPGVRAYADHLGERWVIRTNEGAQNFRLVSAPQADPERREGWQELVPSRPDATLETFALFEGGIAVQERVEALSRVRWISGERSLNVSEQAATTVQLLPDHDPKAAHLRYTVESMVQPEAVWDLHLASGEKRLRKSQAVAGYDPRQYATERLWAVARDGQRIPVTLAWRPDRAPGRDGAPLLITGYGAYGDPLSPEFRPNRISLLDRGFVIALAHVRGGSDLGEPWYEAGRMMQKKNTFHDFIDATDALLRTGWAAPGQVFASGGSAGGLLMGAVANLAGDRYRGITLDVPFVDVVTTMLDETIPLTTNEWTQWGDPRQKAAYDYMLSYSPYDNLRAGPYPAMFVTTGLWDSQVQYYEPVKYVARLRARKTDANPLLLHVDLNAGHGGASGRFATLKLLATEYAFYLGLLGQR